MKKIKLFIFLIVSFHYCNSQSIRMDYIQSFDKIDNVQEVDFLKIINSPGKLMTKQEALDYVYMGDTSRLYCVHKVYNMETEKVTSISEELTLPRKFFFINLGSIYIIANSSFICNNVNKLAEISLTIHIINDKLELVTSLEVYKGNEYDYLFTGIINAQNGNVFINGYEKDKGNYVKLLKINKVNQTYELINEKKNIVLSSENWKYEMEQLGWYEEFKLK